MRRTLRAHFRLRENSARCRSLVRSHCRYGAPVNAFYKCKNEENKTGILFFTNVAAPHFGQVYSYPGP